MVSSGKIVVFSRWENGLALKMFRWEKIRLKVPATACWDLVNIVFGLEIDRIVATSLIVPFASYYTCYFFYELLQLNTEQYLRKTKYVQYCYVPYVVNILIYVKYIYFFIC
jgi:hypothetical protein